MATNGSLFPNIKKPNTGNGVITPVTGQTPGVKPGTTNNGGFTPTVNYGVENPSNFNPNTQFNTGIGDDWFKNMDKWKSVKDGTYGYDPKKLGSLEQMYTMDGEAPQQYFNPDWVEAMGRQSDGWSYMGEDGKRYIIRNQPGAVGGAIDPEGLDGRWVPPGMERGAGGGYSVTPLHQNNEIVGYNGIPHDMYDTAGKYLETKIPQNLGHDKFWRDAAIVAAIMVTAGAAAYALAPAAAAGGAGAGAAGAGAAGAGTAGAVGAGGTGAAAGGAATFGVVDTSLIGAGLGGTGTVGAVGGAGAVGAGAAGAGGGGAAGAVGGTTGGAVGGGGAAAGAGGIGGTGISWQQAAKMGLGLVSGGGGSGGGGWGSMIGGAVDAYQQGQASEEMQKYLREGLEKIDGLYKPGSPEYIALMDEMARKDAAAGRNSQYGPRSVDLAARINAIKGDLWTRYYTGTANPMQGALNQYAGRYSGLGSSLGSILQGMGSSSAGSGYGSSIGGSGGGGYGGSWDYGSSGSYGAGDWQLPTDSWYTDGGSWSDEEILAMFDY